MATNGCDSLLSTMMSATRAAAAVPIQASAAAENQPSRVP